MNFTVLETQFPKQNEGKDNYFIDLFRGSKDLIYERTFKNVKHLFLLFKNMMLIRLQDTNKIMLFQYLHQDIWVILV